MPEPVIMPIAEVCDRYTITRLKQKYQAGNPDDLERQLVHYANGIDWHDVLLVRLVHDLEANNERQWLAEDAIRKGEIDGHLEEVGRQALRVRNLNHLRVAIKNQINVHVQQAFHEEKKHYAQAKTAT